MGIACLQADLKCRHDDLKTTRREIVALRKMVADGPAAHEEVALKLNTTLPVTSREEIADVEQEIKEGGKKKVMVC